MTPSRTPKARTLVEARLRAPATLLICKSCSTGAALRRELKAAVKAAGRKRDVRVVGCSCLDLCPKRGSAAILARAGLPVRCIVVDGTATVDDAFVSELLDERVGDAVSH